MNIDFFDFNLATGKMGEEVCDQLHARGAFSEFFPPPPECIFNSPQPGFPETVDKVATVKGEIVGYVEVKTKPRLLRYPFTGFDFTAFTKYRELADRTQLPVIFVFVDWVMGCVYTVDIATLSKPRPMAIFGPPRDKDVLVLARHDRPLAKRLRDSGKEWNYKKDGLITWRLDLMNVAFFLDKKTCRHLSARTSGNYRPEQMQMAKRCWANNERHGDIDRRPPTQTALF